MSWWPGLKREVKFCEPLSKHITLRVGGVADIWFEPHNLKSLRKILNSCRRKNIPFLVVGKGSNILVKESGVRAVVIHLNSPYFRRVNAIRNYDITGNKKNISKGASFNHCHLSVGCGVSLTELVDFAQKRRLGGCEFLAGIPGTIGGALITNAGVRDIFYPRKKRFRSMGDIIEEVTVIDSRGRLRTLERRDIKFGYRCSNLDKFIILKAKIKLKRKSKKEIESAIDKFMKYKKTTQELFRPSAGSIFKNPPNMSAAKLIDLCGLKGFKIGDAEVSTKHANFIINRGNAHSRDVLSLIKLVQDRVKAKYNIELKPEIRIVGE